MMMMWMWTMACGMFTPAPRLPPGPYRLWDSAGYEALSRCNPVPPTGIDPRPPTWFSGERILIGQAVYSRVAIDGESWWIGLDEPVEEALWSKLREDADGSCPSLTFTPLRTPDTYFVRTAMGVYVANLRTFGFRLLEGAGGGMLEGCEVKRDTVWCLLDQSWDSAVFGPDGVEHEGTFEPWWQRAAVTR